MLTRDDLVTQQTALRERRRAQRLELAAIDGALKLVDHLIAESDKRDAPEPPAAPASEPPTVRLRGLKSKRKG